MEQLECISYRDALPETMRRCFEIFLFAYFVFSIDSHLIYEFVYFCSQELCLEFSLDQLFFSTSFC